MAYNKALYGILFIILILCIPVNASPVIDYSTPEQFVRVNSGDSQMFAVTANEVIDSWEWYLNGEAQSHNSNTITLVLTGRGQQNVTAIGTNAEGTATYSFYPYVNRATATEDTVMIGDTGSDDMMSSISEGDFQAFFSSITYPGVMIFGGIYYLLIVLVPFVMIWNRQRALLIPSVTGLIVGAIMLPLIPEAYIKYMQLAVLLGASAVVWSLYKDR